MNYPYAKKLGLVLAVSSVLAITGCDTSTDKVSAPPRSDALSFIPGTAPRFNPAAQDLPFNTDLVFAAAATSDGTANLGDPTDPVRAAVNSLDGFSTSAYFDIGFDGSLDPDTVFGPGAAKQNVFLLELNTGTADALNPANIDVDNPFILPPSNAYRVDVVSLDGGTDNVVRVVPTAPLSSKSKYLVFMTNGIKDAAGKPVTASGSYNLIRSDANISENLMPVRGAIQGWEDLAAGFLKSATGASLANAKKSLVLTYTFTTTDPLAPLLAMAAPRAALVQAQTGFGIELAEAVPNALGLEAAGLLSTPKEREIGLTLEADLGAGLQDFGTDLSALTGLPSNGGKVYTGYIKLPYYLTAPESASDTGYTQQSWKADRVLGGVLTTKLPPGVPAVPPVDVDKVSYNVTYRYPFAAKTGDESVPLQVTLPDEARVPGYAGPLTCGEIYESDGYPVVIYIHGITTDRTSVAALGHSLAAACVATVAIDLPVHGVTIDTDSPGYALNVENPATLGGLFSALYGADAPRERHFNDAGGSGAQFINLAVLGNTRDNLRQGVMDLLNLNASLGAVNDAIVAAPSRDVGLDLSRINVIGVSLGGIVGTVYATVNQLAIGAEAAIGATANLNPVKGLVVSAGGSQLTQILANSQTFGPVIEAGLGDAGVNVGTTNFERFLYAAQSTVDSGDPVNFARTLSTFDVPVLVQQVVGGGAAALNEQSPVTCPEAPGGEILIHLADKVVPNSAPSAPLTGTSALADLLEAGQVGVGPANATTVSGDNNNVLVNLTIGHHASILRPNECASATLSDGELLATGELQTQAVSFVLSSGAQIAVGSAPNDENGVPTNAAAPFIQAP